MKDPAALLYIDKWIVATTEMKADARAYYMDMILSQFDKGSLPNDIEELATICRVRISEFDNFKQVFEHVLKHKFKQNSEGRLENEFASEIIQKRQRFIDKKTAAGKMSYVIRFAIKYLEADEGLIQYLKDNLDLSEIDTKNEQMLKHVLEQTRELYINVIEDEDKNIKKGIGEKNESIDYDLIVSNYHSLCPKLPKVQAVTPKRLGYINARFGEYGLEGITKVLRLAGSSKFLNGQNEKTWKADFEWLMRPENFVKVLEGKYDNRQTTQSQEQARPERKILTGNEC